jgi:predicted dienelactone hydrolase
MIVVLLAVGAGCGDDDRDEAADTTPTTIGSTGATADRSATFGVGYTVETFVDDTRPTPRSGDQLELPSRTLETVVYYPTSGDTDAPAAEGAAPDRDARHPVIVFSHGLGADPMIYADLFEEWARAGFVVAAPAFPLSSARSPGGPDAGDVQNQPGDVGFLLERAAAGEGIFGEVADRERLGAAGHSNGAITTLGLVAHSCCKDDRVDAAIVFAGTPAPFAGGEYELGETPPVLFVHGTADALVAYEEAVNAFNEVDSVKGLLVLDGADHGSYVASASEFFADVATVTTDFWRAQLLDDDQARERLASGSLDGFTYADEPGSGVTVSTAAPAAVDRVATAEPTSGLVDGQIVTVTWSGYLPGRVVNVVQCSQGGTSGAAECDLTSAQILIPNPTGAGTVDLEIVAGAVGTGRCDATTDDCVIAVNDAGLQDADATIRIPISFAATP